MDPSNSFVALSVVIVTAFVSGLGGSLHCLGMCGGLSLQSRGVLQQLLYQSGRLTGYLTLGGLAGFFGQTLLLQNSAQSWLVWASHVSAVLMGLFFVAIAVRTWKTGAVSINLNMGGLTFWNRFGSFGLGVGTAFLPCGWLQSFVLLAIASKNPLQGLGILFGFWLGSSAVLVTAPIVLPRLKQFIPKGAYWLPKFVSVILLVSGIGSVVAHFGHQHAGHEHSNKTSALPSATSEEHHHHH